ncbi:uncharacterized protein Torip [Polyergus mexicanus]|uniref:uncharacterized protein Torip n=1 Tax=Polyergus mexicanus TaxID=615972 RepID=UPI0038B49F27
MNDETRDLSLFKPPTPKCRRLIRECEEKSCLQNNYHNSDMKNNISEQSKSNSSESATSENDSINKINNKTNKQIKKASDERIKGNEKQLSSQNDISLTNKKLSHINKQDTNSFCLVFDYRIVSAIIAIIAILVLFKNLNMDEKQIEPINNCISQLKSFEEIKKIFCNQESDTWNDIATVINETISRNPMNKPQIILLFANETTTMDCLATALASVSSIVLHMDSPLYLNPENFGDDAGEIITKLKKDSSAKKVVLIRNILNINVEAIKALHNLCDKINPLIREAIYIFTMQTNNYQSSQQKLKFVEDQFYHKLSKSIDQDILMALVTRVTDAAIISVQPEPSLRYC